MVPLDHQGLVPCYLLKTSQSLIFVFITLQLIVISIPSPFMTLKMLIIGVMTAKVLIFTKSKTRCPSAFLPPTPCAPILCS